MQRMGTLREQQLAGEMARVSAAPNLRPLTKTC